MVSAGTLAIATIDPENAKLVGLEMTQFGDVPLAMTIPVGHPGDHTVCPIASPVPEAIMAVPEMLVTVGVARVCVPVIAYPVAFAAPWFGQVDSAGEPGSNVPSASMASKYWKPGAAVSSPSSPTATQMC
jgi:hypothetical protein